VNTNLYSYNFLSSAQRTAFQNLPLIIHPAFLKINKAIPDAKGKYPNFMSGEQKEEAGTLPARDTVLTCFIRNEGTLTWL
jgi:hypothetical protein